MYELFDDIGNLRICVQKPLPHEEHIHGEIHSMKKNDMHAQKLSAAFYTSKLWPQNTKEIKIQFVDPREYSVAGKNYTNFPAPQWTPLKFLQNVRGQDGKLKPLDPLEEKIYQTDAKSAIQAVIKERIQPMVPFKLTIVDRGGDVRISLVGGAGAWSLVGTDCLQSDPMGATLNYGWLDVPTITHELCHAMGMIHEHQNPRGNSIKWNDQAVYQWAAETQGWDKQTTFNNILMKYSIDQVNGSDFDPNSIMLYFFPASLTTNNIGTSQNLRLSRLDVEWMEKMYPGAKISTKSLYKKMYGNGGGKDDNGKTSDNDKDGKGKTSSNNGKDGKDNKDNKDKNGENKIEKNTRNFGVYMIAILTVIFIVFFALYFLVENKKAKGLQSVMSPRMF